MKGLYGPISFGTNNTKVQFYYSILMYVKKARDVLMTTQCIFIVNQVIVLINVLIKLLFPISITTESPNAYNY